MSAGQTITARALNPDVPNPDVGNPDVTNPDVRTEPTRNSTIARARAYFAGDARRTIQTLLGLFWLVDGALQFQSFMYSKGFVDMMLGSAAGQPGWLASTIRWAAHLAQHDLTVFNTLFAVTQVLIGIGLLYRPTVKPALLVSFGWVLTVWWVGEGFGMLLTNTASPLTGAPGAVLLYAIIGLVVWPGERAGGLLGVRGARVAWASLWLAMGWLWLLDANSSANATHDLISAAPSGASWLTSIQHGAANAANGGGLVIALVLASLSAVIGLAVAANWRAKTFLAVAIVLNLAYWVLGQGLGGILTGSATDPNSGPLFILFALALYPLIPADRATHTRTARISARRAAAVME